VTSGAERLDDDRLEELVNVRKAVKRHVPWLASALRRLRLSSRTPRTQEYAIAVYRGTSPWSMRPRSRTDRPDLTRHDVTDVPAAFVADPFLVIEDSSWTMFFEVMRSDTGLGEIGVATSDDGATWTYGGIVLTEPFHLSYPHVFRHDGETYMVPETGAARSVRLYRATRFPTAWTLEAVLLEGASFLDATLFVHGGHWWMFAEVGPARSEAPKRPRWSTLCLYGAPALKGPWVEHPMSPVVPEDPSIARPGGRVVEMGGRLIRFGQDCSRVYGGAVRAFEIHELTEHRYRESPIGESPMLGPGRPRWRRGGMHHVDAHIFDGAWVAAVDGWTWRRS